MQIRIQSFPPLGEVTTCLAGPIQLNVVLEVPKGQNQDLWETELWGAVDGSDWIGQKAERCRQNCEPMVFRSLSSSVATLHYALTLNISFSAQFTLRCRRGSGDSWTWAKDITGYDDGYIVVSKPVSLTNDHLPLPDLGAEWRVSKRASQSPGTLLWALETDVQASDGPDSICKDAFIGRPWGSFLRWFALVRHKSPWLGPRHGRCEVHLDEDAIMCSFQNVEGQHVVLLAVTTDNLVESVLQSTGSRGLQLHARSDSTVEAVATVLVSLGHTFDGALATVMYEARRIISPYSSTTTQASPTEKEIRPAWYEDWADGLGYCTWNALGTGMTADSLYRAVHDLQSNGIRFSNLIIDDGWQSVTGGPVRGWNTFEARKDAFPDGLKATVAKLRTDFPDIARIAVWHAIIGYWGGINPKGEIAKKYRTVEVDVGSPYNQKMHVVGGSDVDSLYKDFYSFLVDAGIDSIKTDVQHILDCIVAAQPRRELISAYLSAWRASSLYSFGPRVISCMSQFPQSICQSQMRQNSPAYVVRNSDDYFPNMPESHTWHVWANSHSSLLTRYLNVLPDWDMFQTKHEFSGFHAAARCLSGGPVYITDMPGEHDLDLLKSITGVTVRGKTVVLRPSVVGRSVSVYVGFEEGHILKVGSYHGPSGTGSPILGVFNTAQRPLAEIVPLSSFTGAVPTLDYVVRSYSSGQVSPRIKCGAPDAIMSVSLDVRGYDILTATPLALFPGDRFRHIWVGVMGLLDKMTGSAAVEWKQLMKLENKRLLVEANLKAFGVHGVWISTLPNMSIDDDYMILLREEPIPRHAVRVSRISDKVLEIDLELAWREMSLPAGWSNEIEVKIYFNT